MGSKAPIGSIEQMREYLSDHRDTYISSKGGSGHIIDTTLVGNPRFSPTLLLKTIGRRTGRISIVPLTYGLYGKEWVVIASKGGASDHPAWYLNLLERAECEMQVGTQCFRSIARIASGEERGAVWGYMTSLYPPYSSYEQQAHPRLIPVVMLQPLEELPATWTY